MNGEAEPPWMDLMAEWWSTHESWAFWDICQNIPKCFLLVKAFICSPEAVLPAAGEAFWLQTWFEETTLGLQVLGETIVGHWRVDADGAVYSSQNVLGSLSFLPVLLRTSMRQLLMKPGRGIFEPSWQKEQYMSSEGKEELNTLQKRKGKVQDETTHYPRRLREIADQMYILMYCWFINQVSTLNGRQQEGRKISHHSFSGSHWLLFMNPWKCSIHFTRPTCWGLWAKGALWMQLLKVLPHFCCGTPGNWSHYLQVCGLWITDSSLQQRGEE